MNKEKILECLRKRRQGIIFFCILIIIFIVVTYGFKIRGVTIVGTSMYPTLKNGDIPIVQEIEASDMEDITYGDIVVAESNGKRIIKRVIGMPGDTIKFQQGYLYRNGKKIEEPYVKRFNQKDNQSFKVGSDQIFICGDNRIDSYDCRAFGPIKTDKLIYKVLYYF